MLSILFIVLYFALGYQVMKKIFPCTWYEALCLAPLPCIFPIIIIGTPIYFFYKLDSFVIFFLLCSPFIFWLPFLWKTITNYELRITNLKLLITGYRLPVTKIQFFLLLSYLIILLLLFLLLFKFQTTLSVLGPWVLIHELFFLLTAVAFILLCSFCIHSPSRTLSFLCIVLFYVLSFSITLILFPLGFGYDPFLHQATERHIMEFGVITPKTFYYLGHYIIIIIFSKITLLPVSFLDTYFLPIFSALSIPAACSLFLRTYRPIPSHIHALCIISFLFIPFSYATLTTPWGFAMVLVLLLSIFSILSLSSKSKISIAFLSILALSILFIHPLAGIIAGGFLCLIFFTYFNLSFFPKLSFFKKMIVPLFLIVFSFAESAAFFLNSKFSGQLELSLIPPTLKNIIPLFSPFLPFWTTKYNIIYDAIYFLHQKIIFLIIVLTATTYLAKQKDVQNYYSLAWQGFFLCIASVIPLILFFEFSSLIWYERLNYITRFFELAPLFLTPLLLIFFFLAWNAIMRIKHTFVLICAILFATGLATSSLYLSYPHADSYTNFHGYTLSQSDINTVRWIHKDMKQNTCVVLANQMVGVAAIREFGFTGYRDYSIQGKRQHLFYYPIPTSSPLYPYFLRMTTVPNREIINHVMDEFHVPCVYFVLNSYENRFNYKVAIAKATTQKWVEIDNGKNFIYSYSR